MGALECNSEVNHTHTSVSDLVLSVSEHFFMCALDLLLRLAQLDLASQSVDE